MRLSLIFELLLIFVLIAFAASRVIDSTESRIVDRATLRKHHGKVDYKKRQQDAVNKYCTCSAKLCNCCRDFNIPAVSLQGPGCASLQYLKGDRLAISMSFGERVLSNTTIDSRKPKPVCMPLPGGVSKFCGRVYNIKRQGEDFNACLGLELRAVQNVEASLRVSCFKFGPKGLKVEPSQPLPVVESNSNDEDDDEDDEDDFDFDPVDEIDDEIEEDDEIDEDDDEEEDDDTDNDVDPVDYGAFSVFDDDFIDSFFVPSESTSSNKRKKVTTAKPVPLRKVTPKPVKITKPVLKRKTTTATPLLVNKNKIKLTPTTITKVPQKLANNTKIKTTIKPTSQVVLVTKPVKAATVAITTTTATPTTTSTTTTEKVSLVTTATLVSDNTAQHDDQSENDIPPSPHESIAAVTMMLQSIPTANLIHHTELKANSPAPQLPEPILISSSSMVTRTPIITEITESNIDPTTPEIFTENPNESPLKSIEAEDNTTQASQTSTEEDEEEDVPQENYIIKNDSTENTDENNEEDYAVQSTESDEETTTLYPEIVTKKQEGKDVLTDIFDGVAETFGVGSDESGEVKKGKPLKDDEKDDDDDDDDDDDFLSDEGDEEENEEDDDDSDDFEARRARLHKLKKNGKVIKGRQSRDMWLGRLHW